MSKSPKSKGIPLITRFAQTIRSMPLTEI